MSDTLNEGCSNPSPTPNPVTNVVLDGESDGILNWDAWIEVAPSRPTRRIRVTLRNLGRDKPLPFDDPHGDLVAEGS